MKNACWDNPKPLEERRKPMANRKRNIQMKFWVTAEEKGLIDEKMKLLPTQRYGAYLRKMAIASVHDGDLVLAHQLLS